MERDLELIRALLMAIAAHPEAAAPRSLDVPGYTLDQIQYHLSLLKDADFIRAAETASIAAGIPGIIPVRLTWEGHEFLEAAKEPTRWAQAKDVVRRVGGATFPIIRQLLTDYLKQQILKI